jgi:pseudouridine-5'-phosphate glycosidase
MADRSEGATLRANLALLENNARVAAQIARVLKSD